MSQIEFRVDPLHLAAQSIQCMVMSALVNALVNADTSIVIRIAPFFLLLLFLLLPLSHATQVLARRCVLRVVM